MRPLMVGPGMKARLEELLPLLRKAFDESKVRRHPKGSSEGGRFMETGHSSGASNGAVSSTVNEPPRENSAARRAVDDGLAAGRRLREVVERYDLSDSDLMDIWRGAFEIDFRKYGPKWRPGEGNLEQTPGRAIHGEIIAAVGAFDDQPWSDNTWLQAWKAGLGGLTRLRYVRGWRYGGIPDRGYSQNYRDDVPERGVSLMEVTATNDEEVLPGGPSDQVSRMFIEASGKDRVWVEGWLIPWRGSDGEPLVVGAREVKDGAT